MKGSKGRKKPDKYAHGDQPPKAELHADVSIPCTPDELLKAVINPIPRAHGNPLKGKEK